MSKLCHRILNAAVALSALAIAAMSANCASAQSGMPDLAPVPGLSIPGEPGAEPGPPGFSGIPGMTGPSARHFPTLRANGRLPTNISAPNFVALTHDGGRLRLSQYRGRIVVLEFWATWFKPCTNRMPMLEHISKRFADKGVTVIALCVLDNTVDANDWTDKHPQYTFPIVLDPAGRGPGSIAHAYHLAAIPTTLVIGPSGRIEAAAEPMTESEIVTAVHRAESDLPAARQSAESTTQVKHAAAYIPFAATRHLPVPAGEILLHGLIVDDPGKRGRLEISAIWAAFPDGTVRVFDAARPKTVIIDKLTLVRMADFPAGVADLKQGIEINVFGIDEGIGHPILARQISASE